MSKKSGKTKSQSKDVGNFPSHGFNVISAQKDN